MAENIIKNTSDKALASEIYKEQTKKNPIMAQEQPYVMLKKESVILE